MMASTASHSVAVHPPHPSNNDASSSSTYGTQTLPIAVPLPDFWHQQRLSTLNAPQYAHPHPPHHGTSSTSQYISSCALPVTAGPAPLPHHASATSCSSSSSGRSHQQSHQLPQTSLPVHTAPLAHAQPPYPQQQQRQQRQSNAQYYAQIPASSCYYREPASTDNSLPIHHHYPVASTSNTKHSTPQAPVQAFPSSSVQKPLPSSSVQKPIAEQAAPSIKRASSPPQSKKVPSSSSRNRSATVEAQAQQQQQEPDASHKKILSSSCSNAAETSSQQPEEKGAQKEGEGEEEIIDEDPELTARFSSVSQIEAQPTIDPNTGEAIYPCPFCDKSYGGKHARSIWRRHLSNKHGIPLNLQPRRTRWDNDINRPKDEAERHKRTLESKRRWAAKNRAEKRAKRKGTTVEEELGVIEAAEAAEAAAASGAGAGTGGLGLEEGHSLTDESYNTSDGSILLTRVPPHQDAQYSYTTSSNQPQDAAYYQEASLSHMHSLRTSDSHIPYATQAVLPPSQNGPVPANVDTANNPPVAYVQQVALQPDYGSATYVQVDAGHHPYTVVYPVYAVQGENSSEARQYQRSPSQSEFPSSHTQSTNVSYTAASISPLDGSFEEQQQQQRTQPVQFIQPVYASQANGQNLQTTRVLQSVSLVQQPFLAPPPSTQHAPSLQRSVSAPIPQRTQFEGAYTAENVQSAVLSRHEPSQIQYIQQPENGQHQQHQPTTAMPAASRSVIRPASSNGMTIYIPPQSQPIQGWPRQQQQQQDNQQTDVQQFQMQGEQVTPLAHQAPHYSAVPQSRIDNHNSHSQQQQQQPPTPYFFLSMPESTPVAEHQAPVSTTVHGPVPLKPSTMTQSQQQPVTQPTISTVPSLTANLSHQNGHPPLQNNITRTVSQTSTGSSKENAKSKRRKESKKKSSNTAEKENSKNKTNRKKANNVAATFVAAATGGGGDVQPVMHTQRREETVLQPSKTSSSQFTKTYQEAAMQLLALASSSPPPSPVKELNDPLAGDDSDDDEENEHQQQERDNSRSTDAEGSIYNAEDSGYANFSNEGNYSKRGKYSKRNSDADTTIVQSEEEEEEDNQFSRFANIPPSSPSQLRMSLSPESSPIQLSIINNSMATGGPSKLSATYLRSQASVSSTPLGGVGGLKRKKYHLLKNGSSSIENDENFSVGVLDGTSDDEDEQEQSVNEHEAQEGERISLDSSPERNQDGNDDDDDDNDEEKMAEMKVPSAKRRLLSKSSSMTTTATGGIEGGKSFRRLRQNTILTSTTTTSGTSRSPSPNRFRSNNNDSINSSSNSSSFATSVIMSTPLQHPDLIGSTTRHHLSSHPQGDTQTDSTMTFSSSSSSLPTGLGLFSFNHNHHAKKDIDGQNDKEPGKENHGQIPYNNNNSNGRVKGQQQHAHRSSIFKIDNCSRPSAVFSSSLITSSSPSRGTSLPFLLSSPEHTAVSKSLGLVPDNFNHNNNHNNHTSGFINLPSDGEGFEFNFLRGYNNHSNINDDDDDNRSKGFGDDDNDKDALAYTSGGIRHNGSLSEYAKDVFGGFL